MRDYSFGNFLHELRLRRGLTQYQLGALVGVSDKAVSKWENGSSKPHSNLLCKLSEVLGISVDELLTCKYHPFETKGIKGVFAMKKQLWDKVFDAVRERYGNPTPIEITNRLLTEYMEMRYTDMIVYFNLLSVLVSEAKKQGEHIRVRGVVGSSFVAYLLGATEINPLKPHNYCTKCKSVIFDNNSGDCWDIPQKICSCGKEMKSDGHNIPVESYRPIMHKNSGFDISVSPKYVLSVITIIQDYFKDFKFIKEEHENNKFVTFTIISKESENIIAVCVDEELTRFKELEMATATCFDRVSFASNEVLNGFRECNTDGITESKTNFVKNLLRSVSPMSFHELIKISGLAHGTGVWLDNGNRLIENGYSVANVIAYRDDVFNYIQGKMLVKGGADTGFAYKVMEDTRRGIYAKDGVPDDIKHNLKSIGIEDWFVESIGKIRYLFPKAHGVVYVKLAAILMWYKLHYPKEFSEIML